MKKYISIFFSFFLISITSFAFAGTTQLTTWYPPPTGAYTQVNLSSSYASAAVTTPAGCTNATTIFLNSATKTLYQCTGTGTAAQYCTAANSGTILADNTGTLHVCNNGTDTIYPQQCYNAFCSYDSSTGATSCSVSCGAGYFAQSLDASNDCYDNFHTSPNTGVISILCCSSNSNACASCVPKTCLQLGASCGTVSDGCGNTLTCGSCSGSLTCGGGGTANVCGGCTPVCPGSGGECGGDGCGGYCNNGCPAWPPCECISSGVAGCYCE